MSDSKFSWLGALFGLWPLALGLVLSGSGCSTLKHLAGKHSTAMVAEIVEQAAELIEAIGDNIEAVVILKMWWLIPGCLLGLGAAAFLLVLKQAQLALALATGFGVTLVLSITVFKHFALIGYIVLGLGVVAAGYAMYRAWLYRDGFSRLFLTGEAVKVEMDEVTKTNVYGGKDDHGIAGVLQNPATERLVLLERKKNGLIRD